MRLLSRMPLTYLGQPRVSTREVDGVSRICYIHAGTHRTGTTYLQTFLTLNERALDREGLYVPASGRIGPLTGHHNLAWQLNGDERFNRIHGTLAEPLAELRSRAALRVCLTSEDFEYLCKRPDALRRLAADLGELGYRCKLIVYLRPLVDYAESLYAELLKHGMAIGFDEFWETFSRGEFVFRERWHFVSDYSAILDAFAAVFGSDHVIVRRYRQGQPTDLVADFVALMLPGWRLGDGPYQLPPPALNTALPPAELLPYFLRNNSALISLDEAQIERWIQERSASLPLRFEPGTLKDIANGFVRLLPANLKVFRRYHVLVPVVSSRTLGGRLRDSVDAGEAAKARRALNQVFRRTPAGLPD